MPQNVLIVGATRGLGHELAKQYSSLGYNVTGTSRSSSPPSDPSSSSKITWIPSIDVSQPSAGPSLISALGKQNQQDIIIISAGFFGKESFSAPDFEAQVEMYKTSAIGPVFLVQSLHTAGLLKKHKTKIILISSEAGSISLRHASEGGGNYGHHGSKAALNMVGKLLSLDLLEDGVAVGMLHPGFMRTEMTKGVGFDKFWDVGGAVTPDVAAKSVIEFVEKEFDFKRTGQFWAPRGPGDIGTAEHILGPKDKLPTPLQLPW